MLRILKDKLRSEMRVWDNASDKNEIINNLITDFVDMLIAIKDNEISQAKAIGDYVKDGVKDLQELYWYEK